MSLWDPGVMMGYSRAEDSFWGSDIGTPSLGVTGGNWDRELSGRWH